MAKRKATKEQMFLPAYGIVIYYNGGSGYLKKTLLGWTITHDKEDAWHTVYGFSANRDAEDLLGKIHRGEITVDAPGTVSYGDVIPIAKMDISSDIHGASRRRKKCGFIGKVFGLCGSRRKQPEQTFRADLVREAIDRVLQRGENPREVIQALRLTSQEARAMWDTFGSY